MEVKSNIIGDFKIIKQIWSGHGRMIYLVKHSGNDNAYAMKVLTKSDDKAFINKAIIEREILLNNEHPFISKLFYSFQTELRLYYIMQFCEAGNLYTLMKQQPDQCFTESQSKYYISCVLVALEFLHFNGIIHRDLKLDNILVYASGHIVLTDFGLSYISKNKVQANTFTKPYSQHFGVALKLVDTIYETVGTAEYMAPEIHNKLKYTYMVDWWAFGIMLYELLHGRPPFKGKDWNHTKDLILKCSLEFSKFIAIDTEDLIKQLLNFNAKNRLGFVGGASEVKDHPFFNNVQFQLLRNQIPPIIPKLRAYCSSSDIVFTDQSIIIDETLLPNNSIWKRFPTIKK